MWTVFFAVMWWVYNPHDGARQANSEAQQAMMDGGPTIHHLTPEERELAAMEIWNQEKGTAAAVIIISWLSKVCMLHQSQPHMGYSLHGRSTSQCSSTLTQATSAKVHIVRSFTRAPPLRQPQMRQIMLTIHPSPMRKMRKLRISTASLCVHRTQATLSPASPTSSVPLDGRGSQKGPHSMPPPSPDYEMGTRTVRRMTFFSMKMR